VKVRWSRRSLRDLREIGAFIRRDNPPAARRWVHQLQERARKAATMPRSGRVVPELGLDDVREVFLGNYRIVYRLSEEGIEVLTVFEGHRLLPIGSRED
jgi:addiction module RelE/StbE family toxin